MFHKVFLRTTRVRRFRSGMIALCAMVAIVLVTVGVSPLLALGTVTVRVDPATRAVPVNGTFTVDIVVDIGTEMDPNGLGAYEFDLVYDPTYLEVDSASDAGGLGSTNRTVSALGPNIDNPGGRTTFAAYSYPPEPNPGPGNTVVLATVTLTGTQAGVATLNLENALLTDTQANAWPDGGTRVLSTNGGTVWSITGAFFRKTDFDGDGTDDVAIRDPDPEKLFFKWIGSLEGFKRVQLGPPEGIPLVGDFDGDGEADPAVWIPLPNGSGRLKRLEGADHDVLQIMTLGPAQGIPVVGDFDGDGRDDPGIWVPIPPTGLFKWFEGENHDVEKRVYLGPSFAIPVVGDFDGDGRDDPGTWVPISNPPTARIKWLEGPNHDSLQVHILGPSHAIPMVGDFDGDGRDDPGVWVPISNPPTGRFKWLQDSNHDDLQVRIIGPSSAIPIVGDFDGDGRDDPGTWVLGTYRFKWFEGINHDVFNWQAFGPSTAVPLN